MARVSGSALVEADFTLLNACNFRCAYCFIPERRLSEKIRTLATNDEWAAAFERAGVDWQIHITGGEPSVYPDFAGLAAALTERNVISLNSNLSGPAIPDFASRVSPDKVIFVNASLHLAERARRQGLEKFLERARLLKHAGFNVMVTAVMTPAFLAVARGVRADLLDAGIVMVPKILRNTFDGKKWPHAYSWSERREILALIDLAEPELENLQHRGGQHMTIDARLDRRLLGKGAGLGFRMRDLFSETAALKRMFHGRRCGAGVSFVSIEPNGDVHRCSKKRPLGNLLAGTLAFMPEVETCDTNYCPYFCFKHTSRAVLDSIQTQAKTPEGAVA